MPGKVILPGSTIGILGGGQLGRMTAIEGRKMGYRIICLDPTPGCPCGQVADDQIVAGLDDLAAAIRLAEKTDVLIYEFENIDIRLVEELEKNYYLPQKSHILAVAQNRIQEKQQLEKAGFPVAPFVIVKNTEDLKKGTAQIGYPSVLKIATGGYDGKGQLVLYNPQDFSKAESLVQSSDSIWVLEKKISFTQEISVIIGREETGGMAVYPVSENIHRENILYITVVPARISPQRESMAVEIARGIAQYFKVVGVLAVEFFVTPQGLLVNEIAPRPHNSGHYTLDACFTSQFEQLIRATCGLPLGSTQLMTPAVMINILGSDMPKILENIPNFSGDVKIYLYGKSGIPAPKRKMGHLLIKIDYSEQIDEIIKTFLG
ncbi:5-(carboxyamino)imidazole ribonucleotide synthase [Desulfitibacter alkalitolerans]|uniref:5-(carboxyamino)imidazole ribonucleotide synthase n=1 Tax=Desulfitibacter alkalitolerans TaxID=264641 RepID=UPI0004857087|nr:5-(carboxyamino)imidazole ribonucleotide synthase [Desulfitibacter alkalitolerans]